MGVPALNAVGIEPRNGVPYVRLDNGVEMPQSAYVDLANNGGLNWGNGQTVAIPATPEPTWGHVTPPNARNAGMPRDPVAQAALEADNLGATRGVPAIPRAPGMGAPAEPVPQPPGVYGPPSAPEYHRSSSYSTEEPYRRTDVREAPSVAPDPALNQQISDSRDAELGYSNDQVRALKAQQAAIAGKQQFQNGTDEQGNLKASSGTGRLLEQQRQNDVDRAEFESHVMEASQMREQRIANRIAQIPAEDPTKMWQGTEGGLARASGIIASAIGGLLAVSTGSGRNLGLEALQDTIDRDIKSQRANIEGEWKKIAADQSEYDRFRQQMGDERSWHAEQAAYRYASLATKLEAEASKYDSQAKQAELQGFAAQVMQKAQEKYTEALEHGEASDRAQAMLQLDRWYKTEQLSLEERRTSAAEGAAAGKNAQEVQPIRIGGVRMPYAAKPGQPKAGVHQTADIYIPADVGSSMDKGEFGKLRSEAADLTGFARNGQDVIRLTTELGRLYDGPGAQNRARITAKEEELRSLVAEMQFKEKVKLTGAAGTASEEDQVKRIEGGALPGGTLFNGSGETRAFAAYVLRGIDSTVQRFESARAYMVDPDGNRHEFHELSDEARKVIDAAGVTNDPLAALGDPVEVANVAMTKIRSGKNANDVIDGFNTIASINATNSQGEYENYLAAGTSNAASKLANDTTGATTKGVTPLRPGPDKKIIGGQYTFQTSGSKEPDKLPLVDQLNIDFLRAAERFKNQPKALRAIQEAYEDAVKALTAKPVSRDYAGHAAEQPQGLEGLDYGSR